MGPDVAKVLFNDIEGRRSVNFPQVSGPRTQEHHRFCLSTYEDIGSGSVSFILISLGFRYHLFRRVCGRLYGCAFELPL